MRVDTMRQIDRYLGIPLCCASRSRFPLGITGSAQATEGSNYQTCGDG